MMAAFRPNRATGKPVATWRPCMRSGRHRIVSVLPQCQGHASGEDDVSSGAYRLPRKNRNRYAKRINPVPHLRHLATATTENVNLVPASDKTGADAWCGRAHPAAFDAWDTVRRNHMLTKHKFSVTPG
jgi:hypothetical protein